MNEKLSTHFSEFFINKIAKIQKNHAINHQEHNSEGEGKITTPPKLSSYTALSEKVVSKLVINSPSKSYESDPLPTDLLKSTLPAILPLLTYAVNALIITGAFEDNLKEALVKALLMRATLDHIDKNYHPVSNIQFTGKLIERAVTQPWAAHIEDHNIMESLQSAYRANHST